MMTRGDGEPFVEEKSSVVAEMLESQWVEGQEPGSACTCKISKYFSVASGSRADIITLWIECKQLG